MYNIDEKTITNKKLTKRAQKPAAPRFLDRHWPPHRRNAGCSANPRPPPFGGSDSQPYTDTNDTNDRNLWKCSLKTVTLICTRTSFGGLGRSAACGSNLVLRWQIWFKFHQNDPWGFCHKLFNSVAKKASLRLTKPLNTSCMMQVREIFCENHISKYRWASFLVKIIVSWVSWIISNSALAVNPSKFFTSNCEVNTVSRQITAMKP